MTVGVEPLSAGQEEAWNAFVESSDGGTIFHRLDFLAYHGERFAEQECPLVFRKGQELLGTLPFAVVEVEGERVGLSPYGGSYGGPVFSRPLGYRESVAAIEAFLSYARELALDRVEWTLPLSVCYQTYSATFRFALLEQGFECANRDVSSVLRLPGAADVGGLMTSSTRRAMRKAKKKGVRVVAPAPLSDFWPLLEKTLAKHEASPTHTMDEFHWLHQRFPERVYAALGYLDDQAVAGVGYLGTNRLVQTSFYLAQDPEFSHLQGLSLVLYEGISYSSRNGHRWFDFGTSTVEMKARRNIFRFKEGFGALGIFRERYVWRRRH